MTRSFLIAIATGAVCVGFPIATSADEARTAEIQRRLDRLAYGLVSAENEKSLTELCRGYPEGIALLVRAASECRTASEQYRLICYFLKQLGPEAAAAVPALLDKLTERYPRPMWNEAASTLGAVAKDSSPVGALVELLKTAPEASLRSAAVVALGSIRDPAAIPQLLIALDDRDANVRTFAGCSLGDFDADMLKAKANAKIVAAVNLRPEVTHISPADAQQIQVNLTYKAELLIKGKQLWTSPSRYICDEGRLRYEVTTPNGEKYRLKQRSAFLPPRPPARFDYGTYDVLDSRGILRTKPGEYWFLWKESRTPRFDAVGEYRIKQSGIFRDDWGTSSPLPFESNEITFEVSDRFASHAALVERTHAALKEELGIEAPMVRHSIREDKDQTKLVTFNISKADYPEAWLPTGTKRRGQYFGMDFRCRFTAEGKFLEAKSSPNFMILCL